MTGGLIGQVVGQVMEPNSKSPFFLIGIRSASVVMISRANESSKPSRIE